LGQRGCGKNCQKNRKSDFPSGRLPDRRNRCRNSAWISENCFEYLDAPVMREGSLDTPVPFAPSLEKVRAIGKKELSRIPIFGFITSRVAVWVDRKDTESRKKSVERLLNILEKGISIVVAPEGTRNNTDQTLLPFQKGAFRIAVETGIPIMPMAVIGAEKIMKRGSILLKPGKIKVYFSSPIDPKPFQYEEGYFDLRDKCFNRLEAMILTHE
jgi:1-acyl-sn-glycerol-3-phosphate acyltransferase